MSTFARICTTFLFSIAVFAPSPASAGDREWTDIMPVGGDVSHIVSHGDDLYLAVERQLYRSSDDGASWTLVTELELDFPDGLSPVSALAVSQQTLLAGALRQIFRSTDGVAWSSERLGESASGAVPDIRALAVAPGNPATVYASRSPGGVYVSHDNGATWAQTADQPASENITALSVDRSDSAIVYVGTFDDGLFITLDGGATWSAATMPPDSVSAVHASPHTPGLVFAAFRGKDVWRSDDFGATWALTAGLPASVFNEVGAFAFDPASAQIVYAGYRAIGEIPGPGASLPATIYRSTDGGATWSVLPWAAAEPAANVNALHVDATDPNTIVAGTREGIYRSIDGGTTWAAANDGLASTQISTVSFGANADELYASHRASGLFGSKDGGATWSKIPTGLGWRGAAAIAADPTVSGKLVSQQFGTGFLVSNDDGANWVTRAGSTQETFPIEFDPGSTSTIYAQGNGEVWKSVDGGDSWTRYTAGLPTGGGGSLDLAVAPSDTSVIYVTTGSTGIYKSVDAGETWSNAMGGQSWTAHSIEVHPDDADTVYAAAEHLYRTTDGGETWSRIGSNIGVARQVAIDPSDPMRMLILGDSNWGIQGTVDGGASWHSLDETLKGYAGAFEATTLFFDPHVEGRYIVATRGSTFGRLQSYTGPIAVDLVASATRSPASVAVGSDISVEFAVANIIGHKATDIEVTITYPDNFTISDVALDGADCVAGSNAFTCNLAELPVDDDRAGTFMLRGTSSGAGAVAISVKSPHNENNTGNDSVQLSVAADEPTQPTQPTQPSSGGGGHAGWLVIVGLLPWLRRRAR